MSPYTCLGCSVIFTDAEIQRYHYKTDWHGYNLKRKIAELPPVTEEEFQKKLDFQMKKKEEKLTDKSGFCRACSKSFSTNNAYENHIKSKKHRDLLGKYKKKKAGGGMKAILSFFVNYPTYSRFFFRYLNCFCVLFSACFLTIFHT